MPKVLSRVVATQKTAAAAAAAAALASLAQSKKVTQEKNKDNAAKKLEQDECNAKDNDSKIAATDASSIPPPPPVEKGSETSSTNKDGKQENQQQQPSRVRRTKLIAKRQQIKKGEKISTAIAPKKEKITANKKATTVLDKVIIAIQELKGGPKGVSRVAISKYLRSEFEYSNANAIKKALQKGVEEYALKQAGHSFRINKDDQELKIEDIKLGGDRLRAREGDLVTVAYVGTSEDGHEFDRSKSFTFKLGNGEVMKGWDKGIVGMKKDGERKLVVPPKFGLGKRGCKHYIPTTATLYFTITLKCIKREYRRSSKK